MPAWELPLRTGADALVPSGRDQVRPSANGMTRVSALTVRSTGCTEAPLRPPLLSQPLREGDDCASSGSLAQACWLTAKANMTQAE